MATLRGNTIEDLLDMGYQHDLSNISFGKALELMKKEIDLEKQRDDRIIVAFVLKGKPEYSITLEAKDGSFDYLNGDVQKIEVGYFAKHRIRPDLSRLKKPEHLGRRSQDMEQLFAMTRKYELDLDYLQDALQKAGLERTDWRSRTATLEGDVSFERYASRVIVNLREVSTSSSRYCRDRDLHITAAVRPQYAKIVPRKTAVAVCR